MRIKCYRMGRKALWSLLRHLCGKVDRDGFLLFVWTVLEENPPRTFLVYVLFSSPWCQLIGVSSPFPRCSLLTSSLPEHKNILVICLKKRRISTNVFIHFFSLSKDLLCLRMQLFYKLVLRGRSVWCLREEVRYTNYYNRMRCCHVIGGGHIVCVCMHDL